MSDRDKLGADHDIDHMLDAIRCEVERLTVKSDDAALRDVWALLQAALLCARTHGEQ